MDQAGGACPCGAANLCSGSTQICVSGVTPDAGGICLTCGQAGTDGQSCGNGKACNQQRPRPALRSRPLPRSGGASVSSRRRLCIDVVVAGPAGHAGICKDALRRAAWESAEARLTGTVRETPSVEGLGRGALRRTARAGNFARDIAERRTDSQVRAFVVGGARAGCAETQQRGAGPRSGVPQRAKFSGSALGRCQAGPCVDTQFPRQGPEALALKRQHFRRCQVAAIDRCHVRQAAGGRGRVEGPRAPRVQRRRIVVQEAETACVLEVDPREVDCIQATEGTRQH